MIDVSDRIFWIRDGKVDRIETRAEVAVGAVEQILSEYVTSDIFSPLSIDSYILVSHTLLFFFFLLFYSHSLFHAVHHTTLSPHMHITYIVYITQVTKDKKKFNGYDIG